MQIIIHKKLFTKIVFEFQRFIVRISSYTFESVYPAFDLNAKEAEQISN